MNYQFSFSDGVERSVSTVRLCSVAWQVSRPDGSVQCGVSKDANAAQSNISGARRLWSLAQNDHSKRADNARAENAAFSAGCKVEIVQITPGRHS